MKKHILKYKNNGIEGLFDTFHQESSSLLSENQQVLLRETLEDKIYLNVKKFRLACIHFFRGIGQHKEKLISLLGDEFEGFC